MFNNKNILLITLLFTAAFSFAQKDSVSVAPVVVEKKAAPTKFTPQPDFKPLKPARAAFYSAVLPGLGQIYNKKYWKAPIVWGALAAPTYFYLKNNSDYKRFRTAYKLRKAGLQDEFTDENGDSFVSLETLETAQEGTRENRDISLMWGVILYVLQIVEASVNAHLLQFNTNNNLTFRPTFINDPIIFDAPKVGFTLKYTF